MRRKQRHIHEIGAQAQALALHRDKGIPLEKLRIYQNENTGYWHVTTWTIEQYREFLAKREVCYG